MGQKILNVRGTSFQRKRLSVHFVVTLCKTSKNLQTKLQIDLPGSRRVHRSFECMQKPSNGLTLAILPSQKRRERERESERERERERESEREKRKREERV